MFKKIYLLTFLTCASTPALGMSSLPELERQLNHVKTQMLTMKRVWNTARLRIKIAEKTSSTLYQTIKPTLDRVISNNEFTTKLDTLASEQLNSIVNDYMSFASTKKTFDISDFFPNVTLNTFGKTLFSAMVDKEYCLMLGRKLAQKMQELEMTITSIQQTLATSY